MSIKQEVNAPLILTIGAVAGVLFLIIVMGLQAWWLWAEQGQIQANYAAGTHDDVRIMLDQQRATLQRSGEVDGKAKMPIEAAMDQIVQDAAAKATTRPAGKTS